MNVGRRYLETILDQCGHPDPSIQLKFEETKRRLGRKISRFPEQLIVAVSRSYEGISLNHHSPPDMYTVETETELGTITSATVFGSLPESSKDGNLISGLKNSFYLTDRGFIKREKGDFYGVKGEGLTLLVDMDEPPKLPVISQNYNNPFEIHIIPDRPIIFETQDSRLEMYIGNSMVFPYLKGILQPAAVSKLSKELEVEIL